MIGQLLGNYKITQKIGAAVKGTVYKGSIKSWAYVVVKVLPPDHC